MRFRTFLVQTFTLSLGRVAFCAGLLFPHLLHATAVTEAKDIRLSLVTDEGQESSTYALPPTSVGVKDILFRGSVPNSLPYALWALEVSNPKTKQNYRLAMEGKVPPVIHWDGIFGDGSSIKPNHVYYMRLILITSDKRVISSPISILHTKQGTGTEVAQQERHKQSFFLFPGAALYYMSLSAGGIQSTQLPVVQTSLRLAFSERHSFGVNVETSPNVVTGVADAPNSFFYSDISAYYFYRVFGALPHRPLVPVVPEYAQGAETLAPLQLKAFGAQGNLEVGLRAYNNILRGFGSQAIDALLSRHSSGMFLSVQGDRRLGLFRLHGGIEGGYSLFRGSITTIQGRLGLSYDRLQSFTPGIEARYLMVSGNAADDADDGVAGGGPQGISNTLLLIGLTCLFKI